MISIYRQLITNCVQYLKNIYANQLAWQYFLEIGYILCTKNLGGYAYDSIRFLLSSSLLLYALYNDNNTLHMWSFNPSLGLLIWVEYFIDLIDLVYLAIWGAFLWGRRLYSCPFSIYEIEIIIRKRIFWHRKSK